MVPDIEAARDLLIEALQEAGWRAEASQKEFAAPYSSYDAQVRFHTDRGVQQGLAHAIELVDALTARAWLGPWRLVGDYFEREYRGYDGANWTRRRPRIGG